MSKRDPLGYYAALNISPDAAEQEIRLAYRFLKQAYFEKRQRSIDIGKIRAAYETLLDPRKRQQYDNGELGGSVLSGPRALRVYGSAALAVLLVILAAMVWVLFGTAIKAGLTSFSPGDSLARTVDGRPLGTVLIYEEHHRFPNGAEAAAYQVRPESSGEPMWYPARDLERHYSAR